MTAGLLEARFVIGKDALGPVLAGEHETQDGDEQDVPYTVQSLVRERSPRPTSAPSAHALALPAKHMQSVAAEPTHAAAEGPRTHRHSVLWRCPVRVRPPSA